MSANDAQDEFENGIGSGPQPEPPGQFALLRVAAGFLSRLPIPGEIDEDLPADALARSMHLFPLVGAGLGALGALVLLVADGLALPPLVAVILALGALIWLTGALHEDGLADVADGFGGGATRETKLAILRDSRIGTYGVLALIVGFALKAAALAAIAVHNPWLAAAALVAAASWSRAMFPPLMRWLPPAREDGVGAGAGMPDESTSWRGLALGAALALLVALSSAGFGGVLVALAAGGIAAFVTGWLALDHIGGYTGDVLGAAQQAAETATLVALSAFMIGVST